MGTRRAHALWLIAAIANMAIASGPQTDTSYAFNRTFDHLELTQRVERPAVPAGQPPSNVVKMHFKGRKHAPIDCFLVASHEVSGLPESGMAEMFQGRSPLTDGMPGDSVPGVGDGLLLAPTVFVAASAGGIVGLGGGGAWRVRQSLMFTNKYLPNRAAPIAAEPQPANFPYSDGPFDQAVDNWGLAPTNSGFCVSVDVPLGGGVSTRSGVCLNTDGKTPVVSNVLDEHLEYRVHLATVLYVDADPTYFVQYTPHSRFDHHLILDYTVKEKKDKASPEKKYPTPADMTIAPLYPVQVFELGFADPSDAGDAAGDVNTSYKAWRIVPFRTDAVWP